MTPGTTAERLETIRAKLDALAARDRELRVHGAATHRYRRDRVLEEREVAAVERRLGFAIPSELRAFVTTIASGGAGPGYGFLGLPEDDEPRAREAFPFSNRQAERILRDRALSDPYAYLDMPDEDGDDWPPGGGYLHLAHQGCGMFDVIAVTGEQRGYVWMTDSGYAPHARIDDGRIVQHGFFDWYEDWLDRSLR